MTATRQFVDIQTTAGRISVLVLDAYENGLLDLDEDYNAGEAIAAVWAAIRNRVALPTASLDGLVNSGGLTLIMADKIGSYTYREAHIPCAPSRRD